MKSVNFIVEPGRVYFLEVTEGTLAQELSALMESVLGGRLERSLNLENRLPSDSPKRKSE
jgi:hypothetical protein